MTARARRIVRWTAALGAGGFVLLNVAAYQAAYAFTHFAPAGRNTPPAQRLGALQKARVLLAGPLLVRPRNRATPADRGLPFERHVFPSLDRTALEAWLIPHPAPRGTVVLFHGHQGRKEDLIRTATAFRELGYSTFLVDFRGSGGSGGNETSIGFHEAGDVAAAFAYARTLPGAGPVVLYGQSMGAAAILKAVADRRLDPAGIVLECPFNRFTDTVRHRFTSFHVPSFPAADALLFWGGVQEGFNPWAFNPEESAASVTAPTLLMSGGADPWISVAETRSIFDRLRGPKHLEIFEGLGHQDFLRPRRAQWTAAVASFLDGAHEARP